jgi:glycosyltransferase involved in cell wall biosynthesis
MKTRVLMLGPGHELVSGISALAKTLVPALEQQVNLLYMPTILQRPLKESGKISLQNVVFALSQYSHFLSALHRFRPHIIHVHTSQGIGWLKDSFFVLIGKACHCRVILHVHAADFDQLYGGQSRFVQSYTRRVMGLADAVIAVSAEWRRYLAHIVPIDQVLTFTNCVAVDIMFPHVPKRSTDGAKALFLGSVGPRKGAFDLLEAVSHLKSMGCSLHLWLAGYEEREGDLLRARTRLEELQLAEMCQLVGMVYGARKTELLNEANLFVLPSYNEGLPIAVLEAMAAGLAVVATPVGGVPEVIKDGYNGFLVPPGDTGALAEKLAILANDQHLREEMGRRSREMAEQELDVKPYANRLVALYESLVRAE